MTDAEKELLTQLKELLGPGFERPPNSENRDLVFGLCRLIATQRAPANLDEVRSWEDIDVLRWDGLLFIHDSQSPGDAPTVSPLPPAACLPGG